MRISYSVAAILLLTAMGAGAGEVYRWVDAQGQVHFGDRPDATASATRIDVPSAPPRPGTEDADRNRARSRLLQYYDEKQADERNAAAQGRRQQEAQEHDCNRARRSLARYESFGRIFQEGPDGQRHYLSAEERDQMIEHLREQVAQLCED